MTWWTLEPLDPLMIRDGRPFGLDTEGARSLPFPTPSVVAGTLRSRIGIAAGGTDFAATLKIDVAGPLRVEIGAEGDSARPLLLAPRDCVLFERKNEEWPRYRLGPVERWSDGHADLPAHLRPVSADLPAEKPAKDAPAFWDLETFRRWCAAPPAHDALTRSATRPALVHETRIHVGIDGQTRTASDGQFFQTDGLRLTSRRDGAPGTWERSVLAVRCADPTLTDGLVPFGGERRLSRLERATKAVTAALDGWTAPPVTTRARVILLTPAIFAEGALPATIAGARVVAAAVGRPEVVSGWDMAARGPKPSRRCAPAGSVYWVELGDLEPAEWAKSVHLQTVSTLPQDQLDGFGLAAVGVWA